jgi:hypothetical protein
LRVCLVARRLPRNGVAEAVGGSGETVGKEG